MKDTVIDFHVHLSEYESFGEDAFNFFSSAFPSKEEYVEFCRIHSDPQAYLRLMDENGVDYSVVLAEISPLSTGVATNEMVEAFCQASPRLIPFCTINPYLHPNMGDMLEDLCLNHGFKGLKLLPSYNYFYPNDNFLYPLYAVAERLGIPVVFHTGSSIFRGTRIKYANPIFYDDVALDFPDMKIIMAHGGRGLWYNEAVIMSRLHKNIYIEVSGLPPQKLLEFFPDMGRFADKFIFGTDWPSVNVKKNIEIIRNLNISQEAISKILGGNAKKILGLA
ncbi:MAG: amidohydrolase family protein [Pelotomaculaceae bacterium]|jgi:predicted TIM-barrel fold metal-dependent hydrolase|nr:amidohydrolase family protein [Bacillota bacterium]NLL62608.1 amidohydrolase [Candidatus Atribacteria bacterium]HHU87685.1 amidohydrolase [Peptococcaceae bacterium]